eukprot:1776499-Prymnesium_polylepis.1
MSPGGGIERYAALRCLWHETRWLAYGLWFAVRRYFRTLRGPMVPLAEEEEEECIIPDPRIVPGP